MKSKVAKYGLPLFLIGLSSIFLCASIIAGNTTLILIYVFIIAVTCIIIIDIYAHSHKLKVSCYKLTRQTFPGISEDKALIVIYNPNTRMFEFNAFHRLYNGLVENNSIFLDKEEVKNLRDMLNNIVD